MARHASGKNNYALSGGVIAALVVAVLLFGVAIAFVSTRGDGDTEASGQAPACVAGDLALPVAATDQAVASSLIDAYSNVNPVVRDFCVEPTLVESIADAAVYIAPNTPVAHQELAAQNRTAATSEPSPVYAEKVGLAGAQAPASAAEVELGAVAFPVNDEPSASALVAATLAPNDQDAVNALTNQRVATLDDAHENAQYIATAESSVPEGLNFSPLDAAIVYTAIPLNQGDNVTEEQSRAGQDFVRVAAENFTEQPAEQPTISDIVWAAATPSGVVTVPADGAMLNGSPQRFSATFPQPMTLRSVTITPQGRAAIQAPVTAAAASRQVSTALPRLAAGNYTLNWTAQGADGQAVNGAVRFMVH